MSGAPITDKFRAKAPGIMRDIIRAVTIVPMSDEDAAAALGSIGVETGGLMLRLETGKPKESQGFGFCQWTGYDPNKSDRRLLFENWGKANGYPDVASNPATMAEDRYDAACLGYLAHELNATWEKRVLTDGGTISGVYYPPLGDCLTLDEKTESFWRLFERPGTPHADWRREMAREALRLYRGGEGETVMPYQRIAISAGHSTKCQGAVGPAPWGLNEVNEAWRVVQGVATLLQTTGVTALTYRDTVSTSQGANLSAIVDWHNTQTRDLDISVHFNAHSVTEGERGVEVLWYTQEDLARDISAAIADAAGFIDRGPKFRDDLTFLKSTEMPAVLLEVCFVDAHGDVNKYNASLDAICCAIADVLAGDQDEIAPPVRPERPTTPPPEQAEIPQIHIMVEGEVMLFVNGEQVGTKG